MVYPPSTAQELRILPLLNDERFWPSVESSICSSCGGVMYCDSSCHDKAGINYHQSFCKDTRYEEYKLHCR